MSYHILNEKILEMQDEIIASIQQNLKIKSVKGEPKENAPYGEGPKAALDDVLALGKKLGFKTGHADNRMGWIEYGEGEEMVGVLGHLDVVPAGHGWEYPPYAAQIHDGMIWGRGILDDKGPIIGAVYALKAIRDLNIPIDRRIRVLFGTDEECDHSCAKHYIQKGYDLPTLGFTPDAEFPAIFFEKGIYFFTAGTKIYDKGKIDVESFEGGTAANAVPSYCKLVVNGSLKVKPDKDVIITKKDGKTIVEATGVSVHGSLPYLGDNAIIKLLKAVQENEFGGDFQQMMDFFLEKIGNETNGKSLGIYYRDEETGETTVNLGVVRCDGTSIQFKLDVRYPNNVSEKLIKDRVINQINSYTYDVLNINQQKRAYTPKDSELITKLIRVYEAQTGDKAEPIALGGGTYAKEFPNMVAFGPLFPGDPDLVHQPNERVALDKLMLSIQITAAAMYELAKK